MFELQAEIRRVKNPRALRRQGYVPAVVYGDGVHHTLQIDRRELDRLLSRITRSSRVTLKVDGHSLEAFIKEIQYDRLTDDVIHVDFHHPRPDQMITMEVPLLLRGEPVGRKSGGILTQVRETVRVRGRPEAIPPTIEVDVSRMEVGDTLHVGDLQVQDVSLLLPLDSTLAILAAPRRVEEVEVAAPAEEVEAAEAAVEEAAAQAQAQADREEAPESESESKSESKSKTK